MTKDAPLDDRIAVVQSALHEALLLSVELEVDVMSADDSYIPVHEIDNFAFGQLDAEDSDDELEPPR